MFIPEIAGIVYSLSLIKFYFRNDLFLLIYLNVTASNLKIQRFHIFLLLFFCRETGNSQPVSQARIGYVSNYTFFVETDLYRADKITYYPDSSVLINLPVVSSRIRLGFFSQGITFSVVHTIENPQKRSPVLLSVIDYKIQGNDIGNTEWQRMSLNDTGNSYSYFIDTSLLEGEILKVSFKKPSGKIIQIIEIEREKILPFIQLFRGVSNNDTTRKSLRTAVVKEKEYFGGFNGLKEQAIQIEPANCLELVFGDFSVNEDSSILYRLTSEKDSGAWHRTGHFALLRNFSGNRRYILEVKYYGSDAINKYKINILPHWYQTTAAKVIIFACLLQFTLLISLIRLRIKWNKGKRRMEQFQYKLRAIQSQLNPHFIFNALNSIQSLVNNDKKHEANQYLTNFSSVLRGTLRNSEAIFIPLSEEIELLNNYFQLEQLRFQFAYDFRIDPLLNTGNIDIPPMLIQPSIENAIKHGIKGRGKDGKIEISIISKQDGYVISIFDNGKWLPATNEMGYGIALTKERILIINEAGKSREILYSTDIADNGTTIHFHFVNWFL